jgi:CBS domain containing-hemolysin-like protein
VSLAIFLVDLWLSPLQIGILNGVLSLNEKRAKDIMTPIKDCLTLPADKIMDHEAIDQILLSGFSRIPIYEPGQTHNFIGMLLVKRVRILADLKVPANHMSPGRS